MDIIINKDNQIMTKYKSVFHRFLKGLISGAVTAMGMVTLVTPSTWSDFSGIFSTLGVAGIFGAINGLLLALNKWVNWKE